MKVSYLSIIILFLLGFSTCKTPQKVSTNPAAENNLNLAEEENLFDDYRGSRIQRNNLVHTKLKVKFDWAKAHLLGEATITFTPHFYPLDKVILDAKGFDIHAVELVGANGNSSLKYEYDGWLMDIQLDKTYEKGEEYTLLIDYTAKPNDLETKQGVAITDNRGLFFINPDGKEDKPQQIWTQGETESSSCWFPTIDSPNQRTTQEMYITVQDKFVTLSNGKLVSSNKNNDGTRTDYWKQDLSHTPYLFMMGIGEYAVVKDTWKGKDVFYYVEPEYEAYARDIFGNTPEMMTFFSELLDYEYPWEKYSQIIVRDYVSGAMENTSAVIYGDYVQKTKRELMDGNSEDVIAHELFHHWFGDLVTCESWANLTLNEGFATYGEYLWDEYKYGKYKADFTFKSVQRGYLAEAKSRTHQLIHFHHDEPDDMFDSHSYNKGGWVLHMLRYYIGDEAFFDALNVYLKNNEYQAVEIHNLRLAFEEVVGEDLNWFFNQWFLEAGHPQLKMEYDYNADKKIAKVNIKQTQDLKESVVFRLPIKVDVYVNDKKETHEVVIEEKSESFEFKVKGKPQFINVDADKMLLCEKDDIKSVEEWKAQYTLGPLYRDKAEALDALSTMQEADGVKELFKTAMLHESPYIRGLAVDKYKAKGWKKDADFIQLMETMAHKDDNTYMRAVAIKKLTKTGNKKYVTTFNEILKTDSSYRVMGNALAGIGRLNPKEGLSIFERYENDIHFGSYPILELYSVHADDDKADVFEHIFKGSQDGDRWLIFEHYMNYLSRFDNKTAEQGIQFLQAKALDKNINWLRNKAARSLAQLSRIYGLKADELAGDLRGLPKNAATYAEANIKIDKLKQIEDKARAAFEELKAKSKTEDPEFFEALENM